LTAPVETKRPSPAPRSIMARQRRSARLAAVQALYQMDVGGQGANLVVREYLDHRLGEVIDEVDLVEADQDYFRLLVEGTVSEQDAIDPQISSRLATGWTLARIDSIVRAILRIGTYELLRRHEVPAKAIVDEHVAIAKAFFDGSEVGLVNAILDRISKETGAEAARAG